MLFRTSPACSLTTSRCDQTIWVFNATRTKPQAHSSIGLHYPSLLWKTMLKKFLSATSSSSTASHLPVLFKNPSIPQIQHLTYASSQRWLHQSQPLCRADLSNQQHWAKEAARTAKALGTPLLKRKQVFQRAQADITVPHLQSFNSLLGKIVSYFIVNLFYCYSSVH